MRTLVALLIAMHAALLLAGFTAPYDPAEQVRSLSFAPPTRLHFIDSNGAFHARPFVYAQMADVDGTYRDDTSTRYPLVLLRHGRLFSVDPPARLSLLGTDRFGRDVFSRLLYGGRISVFAGLMAALISVILGMILGGLAGLHGRWIDTGIMRAADMFSAVPWLYLLFAIRAALPLRTEGSTALVLLVLVIGVLGWGRPARLVRGLILSARERAFVAAAEGFGASSRYLLSRHLLPHAVPALLVQAAILVPQYMLVEVTLSFLGLGVGEPHASWGNMLAALQQYHVVSSCWWMFAPAVAITAVALAYHRCASLLHERVRSAAL